MAQHDVVSEIAPRLPDGLTVREYTPADLPRTVDFQNRYSRSANRQTLEDAKRWESMSDPKEVQVRLVLERGETLVGVAGTGDGGKWRSPDGSWGLWLRIDTAWQRRGIGTAVAEHLEDFARANGAPAISSGLRGDEPHGIAFAEGRGYREYHRRQSSYLDVSPFDASRFDDPHETAGRGGYRLVSLAELERSAPDHDALVRQLHHLHTSLWRDVPSPDMPAPPALEDFLRYTLDSPTFDARATTLALHGEEPVALTLADVNGNGVGYTFMTGVLPAHRGRGLATALKLCAIAALKERGVRLFGTTNDKENAPMLAVNRKLGYRPEPPNIRMKKELAG